MLKSYSIISHGSSPARDDSASKATSIPDFFKGMNAPWTETLPNKVYDLCLLRLAPNSDREDWPAPLKLSRDPPLVAMDRPLKAGDTTSGECFVIGSPNGALLKISGHDKGLSAPRVLQPVSGFYANFTCDVDLQHGKPHPFSFMVIT